MTLNSVLSKARHEKLITEEQYKWYKENHSLNGTHMIPFESDYNFIVEVINNCIKAYKKEVRKNNENRIL